MSGASLSQLRRATVPAAEASCVPVGRPGEEAAEMFCVPQVSSWLDLPGDLERARGSLNCSARQHETRLISKARGKGGRRRMMCWSQEGANRPSGTCIANPTQCLPTWFVPCAAKDAALS